MRIQESKDENGVEKLIIFDDFMKPMEYREGVFRFFSKVPMARDRLAEDCSVEPEEIDGWTDENPPPLRALAVMKYYLDKYGTKGRQVRRREK